MKSKLLIITALAAVTLIQTGCRSNQTPWKVSAGTDIKAKSPQERAMVDGSGQSTIISAQQKVMPTREHKADVCNQLWEQIQEPLSNHDYDKARRIALGNREAESPENSGNVLLFRIGLVTSIINPAERDWRIDKLRQIVDEYCSKGDFTAAYAALEKERKHWNDFEFTNIDSALDNIRKELTCLFYSDYAVNEFLAKYRKQIEELINTRRADPVKRSGISTEIDKLESILLAESSNEQKNAVKELIKRMRIEIRERNISTVQLEKSIMKEISQQQMEVSEGKEKNKQKAEETTPEEQLQQLYASIVIRETRFRKGINLEDEIAVMETASINNSKGLLFAQCAHGLRIMLLTNKTDQINYQNLLSAAIILKREPLMEMAVKCGADVNIAAPDDKQKLLPLLIAANEGDKKTIAWICEKGAQKQKNSFSLFQIATKKNRLDLYKYFKEIGCELNATELQKMFSLCCQYGADNLHEYLVSIGAKPTIDDFRKACEADNLIMVKWFVEKQYFNVNDLGKLNLDEHYGARSYLINRGWQN